MQDPITPPPCSHCGAESDFQCEDCGEWFCTNCLDYSEISFEATMCVECAQAAQCEQDMYWQERADEEAAVQRVKDERNRRARENYRKPENVRKRNLKRLEAKLRRIEQERNAMKEMSKLFSGMGLFG